MKACRGTSDDSLKQPGVPHNLPAPAAGFDSHAYDTLPAKSDEQHYKREGACAHARESGTCATDADAALGTVEAKIDTGEDEYCQQFLQKAIAQTEEALCVPLSVRKWDDSKFELTRLLEEARRNSGQVWQMKDLESGHFVAVKRMPNSWMTRSPEEFLQVHGSSNERPWFDISVLRFLNSMNYKYAVEFMDLHQDEEKTYVVTSFATHGDLFSWCEEAPRPGPAREKSAQPLFWQVTLAVKHLHMHGIVHRDLSLENILLTIDAAGGLAIKLCDFGMAGLARTGVPRRVGKPSYQAPEMFSETPQDPIPMDIFSIGVVLFAMIAHDYPWLSTKPGQCKLYSYIRQNGLQRYMQTRKLRKGDGERLSDVFSKALQELVLGLLALEPEHRLTLRRVQGRVHGRILSDGSDTKAPSTVHGGRSAWELSWLAT